MPSWIAPLQIVSAQETSNSSKAMALGQIRGGKHCSPPMIAFICVQITGLAKVECHCKVDEVGLAT